MTRSRHSHFHRNGKSSPCPVCLRTCIVRSFQSGGLSGERAGRARWKSANYSLGMEGHCLPSICVPVDREDRPLGLGLTIPSASSPFSSPNDSVQALASVVSLSNRRAGVLRDSAIWRPLASSIPQPSWVFSARGHHRLELEVLLANRFHCSTLGSSDISSAVHIHKSGGEHFFEQIY